MKVNEIFYSLQGEGVRAGTPNVFVRFSGCDLACTFCDTEFESGSEMRADMILDAMLLLVPEGAPKGAVGVIFTGGEPALQLTRELVQNAKAAGFFTAIETNGLHDVSGLGLDWITVSPKTAEHSLKQRAAHEVKYVRHVGQPIPATSVLASHYLISPEWSDGAETRKNLEWCMALVRAHPSWRLSLQQHKLWRVR